MDGPAPDTAPAGIGEPATEPDSPKDPPRRWRSRAQRHAEERARRRAAGRPHPGLVASIVVGAIIVASGAFVALVPYRAQTMGQTLKSGSSPVGSVSVLTLLVGTRLDAKGHVTSSGTPVPADAPEIMVEADLHGMSEPLPVSARLVQVASEAPYDSVPVLVTRDRPVEFSFSHPDEPWPRGKWRAIVYVDAFEAAFSEFEVR